MLLTQTEAAKYAEEQLKSNPRIGGVVYLTYDVGNFNNAYVGKTERAGGIEGRAVSKFKGAFKMIRSSAGKKAEDAFLSMSVPSTDVLALVPYRLRAELYEMTWVMICRDLFGFPLSNTQFTKPEDFFLREEGWPILAEAQEDVKASRVPLLSSESDTFLTGELPDSSQDTTLQSEHSAVLPALRADASPPLKRQKLSFGPPSSPQEKGEASSNPKEEDKALGSRKDGKE